MKRRLPMMLLVSLLLLMGGAAEPPRFSVEPPPEMRSFIDGNVALTLHLQAALKKTHGNLIFSPYSLAEALAVAQAGARGQTGKQMTQALHFPTNQAALWSASHRVRSELIRIDKNRHVEIQSATGLWAQKDYGFEKAYLETVRQHHETGIKFVDFRISPSAVEREVDSWIVRETRGKIKGSLPSGAVDSSTRLVIVNAIYFKGEWASRFAKSATRELPFWKTATASVPVPMMRQEHNFLYAEADGVQLLELPYIGRDLSMIVLLPKDRDGLVKVEANLEANRLKAWCHGFRLCKVDVELPRFRIDSALALNDTLRSMGMTDAFDSGRADFTGMTVRRPFFITSVDQASMVEVDEKGTVAASATRVSMGCSSAAEPPRRQFHADHPFLFFIRENATGTILFFGRVNDPSR